MGSRGLAELQIGSYGAHVGLSAVDPAGFNRIVPQTWDLAASKGTLHWKLQLPTCPTPQEALFTSTPVRAKF